MDKLRIDLGWNQEVSATVADGKAQLLVGEPHRNHATAGLSRGEARELAKWLTLFSGMGGQRRVLVESPYAGDVERNERYARACLADCLVRGEAPIASHLLYTQPGVLDDTVPEERTRGINAGLEWGQFADATVVYEDLGVSNGMRLGIQHAERLGRPVERRSLMDWAS